MVTSLLLLFISCFGNGKNKTTTKKNREMIKIMYQAKLYCIPGGKAVDSHVGMNINLCFYVNAAVYLHLWL